MEQNILCHIAGMNNNVKNDFHQLIKNISNDIIIKDLDEIGNKIINDNIMDKLYSKYDDYYEKSKQGKQKIINKNWVTKYKEMEKKMIEYWRKKLEYNINIITKRNPNKKIIFVGKSNHSKNNRVFVKIDTPCKYFVKVNLESNAEKAIEFNLDNYKQDIIKGIFPLKYLDKDVLMKAREIQQTLYMKKEYIVKSLSNIIAQLKLNLKMENEFRKIKKLYVGFKTKIDKKLNPFSNGQVVAYSADWLAITSIPYNVNNHIKRGYMNGNPFIQEIKQDGFKILDTNGYLYEVDKTHFSYHEKGKLLKFVTNKAVKIEKRVFIPNILDFINNVKIKKISFKKNI
jgi:hypothetical protein